MKPILAWKNESQRWFRRNWPEMRDELMSACMGICFLMFIGLLAAMIVEGLSIGH